MTIETCIAHAIHKDLDVVEARPDIIDMPVDKLEDEVEHFVIAIQEGFQRGFRYHPNLLEQPTFHVSAMLRSSITVLGELPESMLIRMVNTIKQLTDIDARFILDNSDGTSLYHIKMDIDLRTIFPTETHDKNIQFCEATWAGKMG